MIKNEIASKYSQALFDLGKENDNLVEIRDELNEVWQIIDDNYELKKVLFHQRILRDEKKEIIRKIFKDEINQLVLNFLLLLIDKRRIFYLEFIINQFNQRVNQEEDIVEVEVTTAITLSDNLFNKLKNRLNQILDSRIIIEKKEDPSILGGMKLKIGNNIIDGSIKNRLNNLSDKLDKIPLSKLGV
ncbi:MAG: ATP synthase F1 subunit delta [Halanaerobiales bacterium]